MGANDNPTTPAGGLEHTFAATIDAQPNAASAAVNNVEFFVRVLTEPQFISQAHASLLTHNHIVAPRGTRIDDETGALEAATEHDVTVVGGGLTSAKYTFIGRILRSSNGLQPHIYLRDPCSLSAAQAADTNYINQLNTLHTQFVTTDDLSGKVVAIGDIVKATLGRSDWVGPTLQVAYVSSIVSTEDQELYMEINEAECRTLLSLMGSESLEETARGPCTGPGGPFEHTGRTPRNRARSQAASLSIQRITPDDMDGAAASDIFHTPDDVNYSSTEGSYFHFYNKILQGIGGNYMRKRDIVKYQNAVPWEISTPRDIHKGEAIKFLCAIALTEVTRTTNNPMATTWATRDPDQTAFNLFNDNTGCVKNYSSFQHGVNAMVSTFNSSHYPNIKLFLKYQLPWRTDLTNFPSTFGDYVISARTALGDSRIRDELAVYGSKSDYGAMALEHLLKRLETAPIGGTDEGISSANKGLTYGVDIAPAPFADFTRAALRYSGFSAAEIEEHAGVCSVDNWAWRKYCSLEPSILLIGTGLEGDVGLQTRRDKCVQHIGPNLGSRQDPLMAYTLAQLSEDTYASGIKQADAYYNDVDGYYPGYKIDSNDPAGADEQTVSQRKFDATMVEFEPGPPNAPIAMEEYRYSGIITPPPRRQVPGVSVSGEYHRYPSDISIRWAHYNGHYARGAWIAVIENAVRHHTALHDRVNQNEFERDGYIGRAYISRPGDTVTQEGAQYNSPFVAGAKR